MTYKSFTRAALLVVIVAGSYAFSRGIILTYYYDIFDSCVKNIGLSEPSLTCQYGPQLSLNVLAGLLIGLLSYIFLYKLTDLVNRWLPLFLGVGYVLAALASWRFLVAVSDSFRIVQGPQTFTEYLFVLYANEEAFFIGLLFALMVSWGYAVSKISKPETGRRALRWIPKNRSAS